MKRIAPALVILTMIVLCTSCSEDTPGPSGIAETSFTTTEASSAPAGPVVRVTDFSITYRLEGQTADSAYVPLVADDRLDLQTDLLSGMQVTSGQRVGSRVITDDARSALQEAAKQSRIGASSLAQLDALTGDAIAPVSGRLESSSNGPVIQSTGIDVVADLTPLQALRYKALPFEGVVSVETVVGQRSAACEAVWSEKLGQTSDSGSTDRLHCRVPSTIETVSGLRASLVMTSRVIPSATIVPNIALKYDAGSDGYSVITGPEASGVEVPVDVGATDGVVRVVTGALEAGTPLIIPESQGQ